MGTRSQRWRGSLRLLLACLFVVGAGCWWPAPAHADDTAPLVQVTLKTVSPAWRTGDRLTISGTVTNTSKTPMTQVQVSLWRSFDPIIDTPLSEVAGYPDSLPLGARTTNPTGNLFNITSDGEIFAPGTNHDFTVSATLEELGLPESSGAYLVGVHVRGIPQGGANQLLGRGRVLWPGSAPSQASISPVVVLSSTPSMVAPGVFTDDHLADELRGRLTQLLTVAEQPSSVVLIDPALFDELTAMSQGYTLTSGEAVDPEGAALADDWLQRLEPLLSRQGVYRLPYGDPELKAISPGAVAAVVQDSHLALPSDHPLAGLGLALAPRSGVVDTDLLTRTRVLRPVLVVSMVDGGSPVGSTGGVTVLNADPSLRGGGPGPQPVDTLPQVTGRLLSELSQSRHHSAVLMVREPADIELLTAVSGGAVVRTALELPSSPSQLPAAVSVKDADASLHGEVQSGKQRMIAWAGLIGEAEQGTVFARQVAAKASSSSLTGNGIAARSYLAQAVSLNGPDVSSARISVTSARSFVMSTDISSFPVTITNHEDQAVVVKVRFVSENPQRLTIPDTEAVTIQPGATASITFTPQAHTNGVVTVSAQVISVSGQPIGEPRRLTVTATSLGDVGWIIIAASGIVLLGTTALRIKQVQRERVRKAATEPAVPAEIDLAAVADRQSRDPSSRPHP